MIEEWSRLILEDYDAIRPNRIFSQNLNIDLDLAYKIQSEVSCPSTPKTKILLLLRSSTTLSDSAFACLDEVADAIIISSAKEEIFFKSMHTMSLAFNSSREFMQSFFNEVFAKLFLLLIH